jgi:VIT1/CCC1 family predicted Fe2+/Mn2+ transporter
MKNSIKKGFSFGLTSGIITTLGLMVGLHSSTHSAAVVIGGILVIAVADALSDALGMHISEESENHHPAREVWESTSATFLAKFVFALTFIVPILFFSLSQAIVISITWGLSLIAIFSFYLAKMQRISPSKVIFEHLIIASFVILATHYIGDLVANFQ